MLKFVWSRKAIKQIAQIDVRYRDIVRQTTHQITYPFPQNLDILKLKDRDNEYWLRIGDYRVIFRLVKGVPIIIEVNQVVRRTNRTY